MPYRNREWVLVENARTNSGRPAKLVAERASPRRLLFQKLIKRGFRIALSPVAPRGDPASTSSASVTLRVTRSAWGDVGAPAGTRTRTTGVVTRLQAAPVYQFQHRGTTARGRGGGTGQARSRPYLFRAVQRGPETLLMASPFCPNALSRALGELQPTRRKDHSGHQ
jgi:hypothetical protein